MRMMERGLKAKRAPGALSTEFLSSGIPRLKENHIRIKLVREKKRENLKLAYYETSNLDLDSLSAFPLFEFPLTIQNPSTRLDALFTSLKTRSFLSLTFS